jgi:hypothetical protein
LTSDARRPDHRATMTRPRTLASLAFALTLTGGALVARAAPDAAVAPARAPEAILADFAKVVGADAAAKHKSLHLRRDLSITGMGIKGTEERWAAAGDKMLAVMTLPGVGVIKQGSTGTVHWSHDPINGLRVLSGAEADMARIESAWNADLRLAQLFAKLRTVPAPDGAPKDAPLECVELAPKEAQPMTMCFDARTHLRVFQAGKQASPQGEVPYVARQAEWRSIEGLMVPALEELTTGPTVMELRLVELTFDGKLPPNVFRMPTAADLAAPAGKRSSKGKSAPGAP